MAIYSSLFPLDIVTFGTYRVIDIILTIVSRNTVNLPISVGMDVLFLSGKLYRIKNGAVCKSYNNSFTASTFGSGNIEIVKQTNQISYTNIEIYANYNDFHKDELEQILSNQEKIYIFYDLNLENNLGNLEILKNNSKKFTVN